MKFYVTTIAIAILFSSCLKQSIADAMLDRAHPGTGSHVTATMSYELNGHPVDIQVTDADNQDPNYPTLSCQKNAGYYALSGLSSSGEFADVFYVDSLTAGNYDYNGTDGDMYFLSYNGQAEFVHASSDYLNLAITSYNNGHISGNFSGQLTPLVTGSTINNIYGTPGSIAVTKGTFQNIPVLY